MAVPPEFDECAGIFLAGDAITGCNLEDCRQQQFRIVEHLARNGNAGEQPHGLDMIAVIQQVGTHQRLGLVQIAVLKQPGRPHHLRRQLMQRGHMTGRHGGVVGLPRHAVEAIEQAPARRQRVIDVHRAQKSLDGLRRLLHKDKTVSAFLMEAAEAGMMPLQGVERVQGVGDPAKTSLCNRHE